MYPKQRVFKARIFAKVFLRILKKNTLLRTAPYTFLRISRVPIYFSGEGILGHTYMVLRGPTSVKHPVQIGT